MAHGSGRIGNISPSGGGAGRSSPASTSACAQSRSALSRRAAKPGGDCDKRSCSWPVTRCLPRVTSSAFTSTPSCDSASFALALSGAVRRARRPKNASMSCRLSASRRTSKVPFCMPRSMGRSPSAWKRARGHSRSTCPRVVAPGSPSRDRSSRRAVTVIGRALRTIFASTWTSRLPSRVSHTRGIDVPKLHAARRAVAHVAVADRERPHPHPFAAGRSRRSGRARALGGLSSPSSSLRRARPPGSATRPRASPARRGRCPPGAEAVRAGRPADGPARGCDPWPTAGWRAWHRRPPARAREDLEVHGAHGELAVPGGAHARPGLLREPVGLGVVVDREAGGHGDEGDRARDEERHPPPGLHGSPCLSWRW